MDSATGFYINIYKRGLRDVYIMINEPNDAPTCEEVGLIENIVTKLMNKFDESYIPVDIETQENLIDEALVNIDINCLTYGYSVIVRK